MPAPRVRGALRGRTAPAPHRLRVKLRPRTLVWLVLLALAAWAVVHALRGTPLVVDVATVRRGSLVVTVDDDGRTRVRERYTVHAPIRGRLLRTVLEAGDAVRRGDTVVAELEPIAPVLLDERSRAEAEARVSRAGAAVDEAKARREQAAADAAWAESEHARTQELVASGIAAAEQLEASERAARSAREAQRAAEFAVQVATFEAELASVALREGVEVRGEGAVREHAVRNGTDPRPDDHDEIAHPRRSVVLHAPIDGTVLRVFEESQRTVEPGTPLVELGDLASLEIVADFLSQDAVRVRPGMRARIVGWGGEGDAGEELALQARVRVVGPSGVTKVSALGVEEQRVDVVLDPVEEGWGALGDGYRVEVRVEVWSGDGLLLVPAGALYRSGEAWGAFVVGEGEVVGETVVRVGRRTGLMAEVLEGLEEGERVVMYPSVMVEEGVEVEGR